MNSKNLVLLTSSFPFGRGEQFLETEIKILAEHFDEITIIPSSYDGQKTARPIPDNIRIYDPVIPVFRKRINFNGLLSLIFNRNYFSMMVTDLKNAIKKRQLQLFASSTSIVISLLGNSQYQKDVLKSPGSVIYYYWGHGQSYALPYLQHRTSKKIVMRLHRGDLYENLTNNYLPNRLSQLEATNVIVPISDDGKYYLNSRYPQIAHKIQVSKLGTQPQLSCLPQKNSCVFRIVSVSAVTPVKRIHKIAKALSKISTHCEVNWTHFGEGTQWEKVEKYVRKFPENITFERAGFVSNTMLMDFYRQHHVDVFMNVSESEGIPVSIMEAISFGIPVIATDVGGNREAVPEQVGILLPQDLPNDELVEVLEKMIANEHIFERSKITEFWSHNYNAKTITIPSVKSSY